MDTRDPQCAGAAEMEVPSPVLFNTFKHHAGALRHRIACAAEAGPGSLVGLRADLAVLGTRLMDLYTGQLSPRHISAAVLAELQSAGLLGHSAFAAWLAEQGGFAVVTLPEDSSRWVLRLGDSAAGRHVHLHPGRWSPETVRVRATVLKTACLSLAHARLTGGDPLDREGINAVRRDHLGLPPLGRDPEGEQGLGAAIELLRRPAPRCG